MLAIPVRERNLLLVAAGFAPIFQERPLEDPALNPAKSAIDMIIEQAETLSGLRASTAIGTW